MRVQAQIYKKGSLSIYQQKINDIAGELCARNPALLTQRGLLLEEARKCLDRSGYQYKKGKSRSKHFGSGSSTDELPTRPKIDKEVRDIRIRQIKEQLSALKDQIHFKEKRIEHGVAQKDFKLCDGLADELHVLKEKRNSFELELQSLLKKEKKADWYQKQKSRKESQTSESNQSCTPSPMSSHSGTPVSPTCDSVLLSMEDPLRSTSCPPDLEKSDDF